MDGEVPPSHPALAFLGVTPLRPPPYRLPNLVVHCSKDWLGDRVPVEVRPTAQQRIQRCNQVRLGRRPVSLYESSDSAQETDDTLPRGFGQELAVSVPAYIMSEEVEALFDMDDAGLLLREFQPSDAKKIHDQRFDFILQHLFRAAGDDE